jgi:release factor glutamine methyltransferase
VDPRVLIPRPETEVLVQSVLDRLKGIRGARIADFGTGSGCVAVSLAHELPGASVFATDRSPDAIRVALGNARRNGVAGRVRFAVMDLGEGFGSASDLDALACNPPYVPTGRIPSLQVEVRAHEPRMALDGGEDGLRFYPRLAQAARASLRPGGWLALEVGQDQAEPVREIAAASGLEPLPAIPDLTGRPRVVLCRRG